MSRFNRQNIFTFSLPTLWIYFFILSFFFINSSRGYSVELAVGMAIAEEGDDRIRPAVALHLGYSSFYYSRIFYYGRDFGPVKERTTLVSFNRRFGLFRSKHFKGGIGGAILSEHNIISYEDDADKVFDQDDNRYNLGLYTGIYWDLGGRGPFYFSAGWESAVFPAGLNGLIFLSTGRKQFISLTMGVVL